MESIDDTEAEDGAGEGVRAGDGRVDEEAELEGSGGGVGIWRAASISSFRKSSRVVLKRCNVIRYQSEIYVHTTYCACCGSQY